MLSFPKHALMSPKGRLRGRCRPFQKYKILPQNSHRAAGRNLVMLGTMVVVRNMLTGLLALALTFGTGWGSCVTLEQRLQRTVAPTTGHMTSHGGHEHSIAVDRELVGKAHVVLTEGVGQRESNDDACPKCCGVCVLTSILPRAPLWIVALVVSRVSFAFTSEQLRGRIVLVDPDIPKQVA
jgi:hypothetical protein